MAIFYPHFFTAKVLKSRYPKLSAVKFKNVVGKGLVVKRNKNFAGSRWVV